MKCFCDRSGLSVCQFVLIQRVNDMRLRSVRIITGARGGQPEAPGTVKSSEQPAKPRILSTFQFHDAAEKALLTASDMLDVHRLIL